MSTLKELYDNNVNIMQYLRDKKNFNENDSTAILTSYDMQAGSYVKNIEENKIGTYYNGSKKELSAKEYQKIKFDFIAQKFNEYIYIYMTNNLHF